jgi:hypothetical protein
LTWRRRPHRTRALPVRAWRGAPSPPPAAEARCRKVLAILARDGTRYAVYVEDPNTDPVIMALATPDGTCEVQIPKDRYDPFAVLAMVEGWEREPDPLWWRVAIADPGGRTVEVDTPSGYTLTDCHAYALRYHGPGCTVTPLAELPKPRASVNLDEALAAACEGTGITPETFRSLLSPEDIKDIEAGSIPDETLKGYAMSFTEAIRSGRIYGAGGPHSSLTRHCNGFLR